MPILLGSRKYEEETWCGVLCLSVVRSLLVHGSSIADVDEPAKSLKMIVMILAIMNR
jgi:hypothetical protein